MKNKITGIYKITNIINNKVYIGQSVNIKQRFYSHKSLYKKEEQITELYKDMRKEGINNFKFEILLECEKEELDSNEKKYIEEYNSYKTGYNNTSTGKGKYRNRKTVNLEEINEILNYIKIHRGIVYGPYVEPIRILAFIEDKRTKIEITVRMDGIIVTYIFQKEDKYNLNKEKLIIE